MFKVGVWEDLKLSKRPQIMHLVSLLETYMLASRADSTVKSYTNAFLKWCKFARENGFVAFPAQLSHVSLYLTSLIEGAVISSKTKQCVEIAYYSIQWMHGLAGLPSPTCHPFVKSIVESAKRLLGKPVTKKKPVTASIIQKLVEHFKHSDSLLDIRDLCIILLAFAGFFRYSDLINIRRSDINFSESHVCITVSRSKTDQYNKGTDVCIASTGKITCPVAMLNKYLNLAGLNVVSDMFIFRPMYFSKGVRSLIKSNKKLSYSSVRELVKRKLALVVPDVSGFGTHSFRIGGATAAAHAGITDRCLKRHGRWKSDRAKDGYIQEDVESLLNVSSSLGI